MVASPDFGKHGLDRHDWTENCIAKPVELDQNPAEGALYPLPNCLSQSPMM